MKYPTDSLSFSDEDSDIKKHKLGFFSSEQSVFQNIANTLGTIDEDGNLCRHPLAFMLEAADDIAYSTADLEDAFKKKLFTLDEFIAFFKSFYDPNNVDRNSPTHYSDVLIRDLESRRGEKHTVAGDATAFKSWLNYTRRWLMYVVVYRFSRSYREIMAGTYTNDLFYGTNHSLTIKILKKAMGKFAFNTSGILKLELSARSILSFLLNSFVHAVLYHDYEDPDNHYVPSKADNKLLSIFSENYKQDYENAKTGDEKYDLYLRLLMVTDYISGMTDSYARTLYRELSGIE